MPLFMVLYGSDKTTESGKAPTPEEVCLPPQSPHTFTNSTNKLAELKPISDYSEKLARDGKLIWGDALYPSSLGARVMTNESGETTVQKGPFDQGVGGYAVLTAGSLEEAIDLVKSGPLRKNNGAEIRQIASLDELPVPEEQKAKAKELKKLMRENAAKQAQ
jgi:hypothetical protein